MSNNAQYLKMQLQEYEHSSFSPETIVGYYDWHEAFPYETLLLHENGDLRYPVLPDERRVRALDFGCGPGRMMRRMAHLFEQVDGVDLSPRLLEEARKIVPVESQLWVTSGNDLGDAPRNAYDFIYCTISMQHIAVWDIRMQIMRHMKDALKVGGCVTLQMAFNVRYPWVASDEMVIRPRGDYALSSSPEGTVPRRAAQWLRARGVQLIFLNKKVVGAFRSDAKQYDLQPMQIDRTHASWRENRHDVTVTNGACDVAITKATLPLVEEDFVNLFGNFKRWWYDVSIVYDDLRGEKHGSYWATHWIFLHAKKTEE